MAISSRVPDNVVSVLPYATVAASQSDQILGNTGSTGDYLSHITVFPAVAGCGGVTIKDGSTTVGIFAGGGSTALPTLAPFTIVFGARSVNGPWKITTGASVSVMAFGEFS